MNSPFAKKTPRPDLSDLLSAQDIAELRDSGLTDATIRANRLRTEYDADAISSTLGHGAVDGPALVFPYHDSEGNDSGFARIKPHIPRELNGKLHKYEHPKGEPNHAYFPVGSLGAINDGTCPLFITEGEKKALALSQHGFPAIGLGGVDSWGKNGQLIDDLRSIPWSERSVYVCFDHDAKAKTQQNVNGAIHRLSKALHAEGANVLVVHLPPPRSGKQGVDDFLVLNGAAEFQKLVERAVHADGADVVQLNDLTERQVEWLDTGRIPFGMLTLLDGDPGLGKSLITSSYIARLTAGFPMPLADQCHPPMNCLLLSAEDDPECTIMPRLRAARADMSRVFTIPTMNDVERGPRPVMLPGDIDHLRSIVTKNDIRFIVIDPIMAYLDSTIDTNSDSSVRLCLTALKDLARSTGAAILLVRHLNKRSGGNALYRGGGSIAFTGAVRSNLCVGRHPSGDGRFVLASSKSNLGPMPKSLVYAIAEKDKAPIVNWLELSDLTAGQVIDNTGIDRAKKLQSCTDEIERQLADNGPMTADDLQTAVMAATGVGERTFKSARKESKSQSAKEPGSMNGRWWCKLSSQKFAWEKKGAKSISAEGCKLLHRPAFLHPSSNPRRK